MPNLCCADCILTALNTIQEVLFVVIAVIQVNLIRPDFARQKRLGLSIDFAALYIYPSFATLKTCMPTTAFKE